MKIKFILPVICCLFGCNIVRAQTTNLSVLFPGLTVSNIVNDLNNLNTNSNFTPTNLLLFLNSNYSARLKTNQAWTFNSSTQIGMSNGTVNASAQFASGPVLPMKLGPASLAGGSFTLSFQTVSNQSYTVQSSGSLPATNWVNQTNFLGNGFGRSVTQAVSKGAQFFRVSQP